MAGAGAGASAAAAVVAGRGGGRFTGFVRVSVALQTAGIFFQAVTAGTALTSEVGSTLHDLGSKGMYAMSMLYLLAAVLAWRPGGGPARPALYATGFLLLGTLQVVMGVYHVMAVHLPLGVLMFGLSMLDLGRVVLQRTRSESARAS
ncbi:hypothetical protein AB0O51_08065 [Streptomyces sp. NPDC090301]|uniref:hypothetical protein n=1 Tax=unclassified Streptomyces TaxID=2593676 RepID=UPI001FD8D547|nr:hypothetical protein [Streptomyces sp. PvR006]